MKYKLNLTSQEQEVIDRAISLCREQSEYASTWESHDKRVLVWYTYHKHRLELMILWNPDLNKIDFETNKRKHPAPTRVVHISGNSHKLYIKGDWEKYILEGK